MDLISTKDFIKSHKNILKEGSWVLTGQIIVALINLAGIRIVTEFLSADTLGEATMWLGISVLLKNIFISPFLNYQIRFYPEYLQKKNILDFNAITFKILMRLFAFSSVFLIIITIILSLTNILKAEYIILIVLTIYFLMDTLKSYFINQYQAERKQKTYALWVIFESIIIYAIIYVIIKNFPFTESYIAAMSLGILFGIILFRDATLNQFKNLKPSYLKTSEIISEAKKFSLPFIPMAILSWIMNLSSRYFIGIIGNTFEAGIFVAAFSIASRPFIMLSGIATNFFRPVLFEATSIEADSKVRIIFNYWLLTILVFGIILICIFAFGSNYISEFLLSPEYRKNIASLFLYIGLGYFFLAIYQIFENFLFAFKKTKVILYSSIFGTIVFIVSNILLVTNYSSTGAAISVSIAFGLQLISIILFFISKRGFTIV